jgi:ABC-type oligopeptide transport system ATPase subunit
MIIGINGKIGSGKDTVGSIIQYLTAEDTGKFCLNRIHSGKSIEGHHNSTWEIKKFAGKLKQTASLLTGIPIEKFEDQEFKKTYLGEEWNSPYNIPFSGPDFVEHDGAMTVRTLLQRLGTEAMRDNLHENVWVNALFADYIDKHEMSTWGHEPLFPNWIITDMRFPNEMDAVYKREGCTIRVVRDYALRGGPEDPKNIHPSETALDDSHFDYEIINDGTIEDLIEKVREILIKEDLL